jgi:glycosyltransferase involved in cell wall biosynthesis
MVRAEQRPVNGAGSAACRRRKQQRGILFPVTLSVVIIACNEEANLGRALASLAPLVRDGRGEIIVVDAGSTDRTVEIAQSFGARVFLERWKGYAAQKNSAIEKATGDWILSLDADESLEPKLAELISGQSCSPQIGSREWCLAMMLAEGGAANLDLGKGEPVGFWLPRKNFFLGRWIRHGGFWPDHKLRLFRRGKGRLKDAPVHETIEVSGNTIKLPYALIHHSYPTLFDYIEHMNRYSSLGAEMAKGDRGFSIINIVFRPLLTFAYNYFFRLGFLDGREGLLLHLYHAVYVSWKYAKAWESEGRAVRSDASTDR